MMGERELKDQLDKVREMNQELINEFKRISELTSIPATVIAIQGHYAVMSNGTFALNNKYEVGQLCLLHPQTGQVVKTVEQPFFGDLHIIDQVHENPDYLTILIKGERRVCYAGNHKGIKPGDTVLLDPSLTVVTFIVEKARAAVNSISKVTWDDIGGHEEAKLLIREAIEFPYLYSALYQSYQKSTTAGILLYGPPGCGKTLMGKAVAHALKAEEGFILVKGGEVLNEYLGVTERNIRNVFAKACDFKEKHGKPAVIFIDEADAIMGRRGDSHNYGSWMGINTFLTEMDGLNDKSAIVFLSTNRKDSLDEAVIRDGRIDHKIEIKRPDKKQAHEIFNIHIRHKPIMKGHNKENLVEFATSVLYQHDIKHSGALIAGCVDKAVTHALRRDLAYNRHASGLCEADFIWATEQIINQEVQTA